MVPIPGFEHYFINDMGFVFSNKQGRLRIINPAFAKKYQYAHVGLSTPNGRKTCYVHRLMALTYFGPCPEGMEVNHKNGDHSDNRLENLEYLSKRTNRQQNRWRQLSPETLSETRRLAEIEKLPQEVIAKIYGVTQSAISQRLRRSKQKEY